MLNDIGPKKWKWYQFKADEQDQIGSIIKKDSFSNGWLEQVRDNQANSLRINVLDNGEKVVKGSLIYKQSFEAELDYKIFHFYVTSDQLITVDLNLSSLTHILPKFFL